MRHSILSCICSLGLTLSSAMALAADAKPAGHPPKDGPPRAAASSDEPAADARSVEDSAEPEPAVKPRRSGSRPTSIDVIPLPTGLKTVTIRFRWSLVPKSSIEVRLVPSAAADPKAREGATQDAPTAAKANNDAVRGMEVAPVYFSEHLKGKVQEALFRCSDHAGERGSSYTFTKDKIQYKMIGRKNSLDRPAVHVQVCDEDGNPEKNPAAAFLQLDAWAVDRETIAIDLPRDEFAQPGRLYIWFFRGDTVVWEEQIRWPGYR